MHKRSFLKRLAVGAVATSLGTITRTSFGQTWPSRPIRVIVSFAPGGLTDQIGRVLVPSLQEGFGQPVIIDNHPGAGGTLAEGLLAKSPPDGYTILLSADSVAANPHLVAHLPYDTFKDLIPISMLARIPLVLLVNNSVPANTVKEFVALNKRADNAASYGSPGIGTSNHLYFELFKAQNGLDITHVAYKGGGPAITDLMGGHIQSLLISSTLAVQQVASGKVKALAVTSDHRLAQLPAVPTFAEAGFADFKPQQWTGLFVPAGTPSAVTERIHAEFAKALRSPEVIARLSELNAEPVMNSQRDFSTFLRSESDTLGKLIRAQNITAN